MQGENDENCSRTEYNSIISFTYAVRNKITEKKKKYCVKGRGCVFFLKKDVFLNYVHVYVLMSTYAQDPHGARWL